jgi:hypothetical protein
MFQDRNHNRMRWKLLLSVALASIALFAAVAGTIAWLAADRSLTTLTKIDFVTLTLEGRTEDSVPVNLGALTIGEAKEMPFRIVTKKNAKYILQLAHTTNLPLTYEIYTADEWAKKTTPIKEANAQEKQHHAETYGTYTNVQINAEPLYWLSNRTANATTGIDYYVLVVNWKSGTTAESVINKDTEMVYLSASLLTTNTGTTGGTGNAESSEPTA